MDSPLFLLFLFVHLASLMLGFGSVLVTDVSGLLWLLRREKMRGLMKITALTEHLTWIGWFGLVGSGACLIFLKGYMDNLTWLKLFFVALVGINGVGVARLKDELKKFGEFRALSPLLKFRVMYASFVSQIGWWGAILIGFIHRHYEHYINWPAQISLVMLILASGLVVIKAAGELCFGYTRRVPKSAVRKA